MQLVARLIEEAWEHRRRRLRTVAVGVILFAAAVAGVLLGRLDHSSAPTQPASTAYRHESPSQLLVNAPLVVFSPDQQLGDRCAVRNSLACDSIGVFITPRSPATAVSASINGQLIQLHQVRYHSRYAPTGFSGQLYPHASAMRSAPPGQETSTLRPPIVVSVQVFMRSADGALVTTRLRVTAGRVSLAR